MKISHYFEKKKNLYTQNVKGKFRSIKNVLNIIFLSIYLFIPFIRFDRGHDAPNQAILIDIPNSRLYFFAIEIWPQEVYYLAGILILSAVMLFFVTSLFGRIWCGYACFQTVWSDIFLSLERFFQGDRNNRILLDREKSWRKFYKKLLTHFSWILVSIITGCGFVFYFNDSITLVKNILSLNISLNILGWIIGIAAATYIMAGFAREHVCTFMCPYSRFQSAMFDKNTLIITYDSKRGEMRGKHKQGESFANRGHCIDCKQCVVVCPQGIDIRNGLQLECIACGLCIDACDNVMEKIGLPKGLIRYDTENFLETRDIKKKFKIFSARFFYYSAIISIVSSVMIYNLLHKSQLEINTIADRNPLFVTLSDGSIRNGYSLKILNKTNFERKFKLILNSPKEANLKVNSYNEGQNDEELIVKANESASIKIYLSLPADFIAENDMKEFLIKMSLKDENSGEIKDFSTIFIAR